MRKTRITYRVPYADTDKMGVVYYANYLEYFERVRNEMLRDANYSYRDMESAGLALPVIEAWCRYRSPAFYDDSLRIHAWFGDCRRTRIKIHCEVVRNRILLADGFTVHACVALNTGKPSRLPAELLRLAAEEKLDDPTGTVSGIQDD